MGLDKPLVEQYQHFIVGLSRGDLGLSFLTKRPVNDDIAETFAATFELVLATIAIAFLIGVPLGVVAAAKKDGWVDNLVRLRGDPRGRDAELPAGAAAAGAGRLRAACAADDGPAFPGFPVPSRRHRPCDRRRRAQGQSRRAHRRAEASPPAVTRALGRDRWPDRPHHPILDDRRRQAGLHRGGTRLRHPGPRAHLQIHAAPRLRAADDDPGARIRFAPRQRLRGRARLRLARHGELRRSQHPAEGSERASWAS